MCTGPALCTVFFVVHGFEPDQYKQMSVSISGGCTSTVTQRHSYRKRLVAFGLILVGVKDVVMRQGLKGGGFPDAEMRREMWAFGGREW